MKQHIFISILLLIFVSGCAVAPTPQNAQEYRAAVVKGGSDAKIETYTVNRSYSKVVNTLQKKTKQCLYKKLTVEHCPRNSLFKSCSKDTFTYKPTFIKKRNNTELHVQMAQEKAIFLGGKPPKGGMYIVVADVRPVGKNKTEIKTYSAANFFKAVPKAIKHWAEGTNLGCPDFAQAL